MGYHKQGNITSFTPDNDANTLYLQGDYQLDELLSAITDHFGNVPLENLTIRSEYIHTDSITYDRYDPGDYTNYIVVTVS
jgi:hypothetical protein